MSRRWERRLGGFEPTAFIEARGGKKCCVVGLSFYNFQVSRALGAIDHYRLVSPPFLEFSDFPVCFLLIPVVSLMFPMFYPRSSWKNVKKTKVSLASRPILSKPCTVVVDGVLYIPGFAFYISYVSLYYLQHTFSIHFHFYYCQHTFSIRFYFILFYILYFILP